MIESEGQNRRGRTKKNAGKMPSFQFYPADWRKDPAIQSLDYETRGVWFEMLCIMHESKERGVLLLNGYVMPEDALARLLGLDNQKLSECITKLLTYGVAKRRISDGAIFNKRMVEDERLCEIRRNAGKMGGNPALLNQNPTTGDNQNSTPSSSSSFSSSDSTIPADGAAGGGGELKLEEGERSPGAKLKAAKKKPTEADPRHREFIEEYSAAWGEHFGDKYPFHVSDADQLARLLKTSTLTVDSLMRGVRWCWSQNESDGFVSRAVKQAATIRGFCTNYAAIIGAAKNSNAKR